MVFTIFEYREVKYLHSHALGRWSIAKFTAWSCFHIQCAPTCNEHTIAQTCTALHGNVWFTMNMRTWEASTSTSIVATWAVMHYSHPPTGCTNRCYLWISIHCILSRDKEEKCPGSLTFLTKSTISRVVCSWWWNGGCSNATNVDCMCWTIKQYSICFLTNVIIDQGGVETCVSHLMTMHKRHFSGAPHRCR